jgi:branched-subunit amino acid ABC-type transport system permease component
MQEFQLLAQLVLPGLTTGCVYALIALGFVLCFNVSGVVNMAQGEYVMLGGVLGAWMVIVGVPLAVALIAATAAGAILGIVQERLTLAPVRRSPAFIQITVTLGVAVILRGIALIIFGKDPLAMPGFSGDGGFAMLGAMLPVQALWVWGTTALMLLGIFWFLQYTDAGRAVRACSINLVAARLMGVNAERMTMMVFALAGGTGALAGAVITPIVLASWDAGFVYSLKGFIGAILGGLRSPIIAVVGGLGVGIAESLAAGYVSSGWKDAIVYGLLLAFLLIRGGVFLSGRVGLVAGTSDR